MRRLVDLDAYLTGEMADGSATDAFEAAMFDAPDDPNIQFMDAFLRHGATLAEHGTFFVGVTGDHIEALKAKGHVLDVLVPGAPGSKTIVPWNPNADLYLTKVELGRTDLDRIDVEITVHAHSVTKTMRDVLVDNGTVFLLCEKALAEIAFQAGPTTAVVRRAGGSREVIAEYHFAPQA